MAYADLLRGLAGTWRLTREVSTPDGACGAALTARMEGQASFSLEAGFSSEAEIYRYIEEGELVMAGGSGAAIAFSRGYIYGALEHGLDIYFDDDQRRLFQHVTLLRKNNTLEGEATHLCVPDTYRSRYRFDMPDAFEIFHAVEGPRKRYVIHSRYDRAV